MKITVDGRDIEVREDQSLLQGLLDNGFDIPNLCFHEELEAYGGCGLCLVEIAGQPRPARACVIMPSEGMQVTTESERIIASRRTTLAFLLSDHLGDCRPPCRQACPSNQDCQGYVGLIAEGRFDEAFERIMEDNPLPACIGRVCPHPCEDACRRALFEGPLSLMRLKRFAAEAAGADFIPAKAPATGKRVAVIGAGPAGLSAAYFLARKGHHVEIFEKMPAPGGMLRYGIPAYRLPKDIIDSEVARIERLGVVMHYGQALGKDITLDALKDSFDAVFVAVGAWAASPMRCENDALPGVLGGIDFLEAVARGEAPDVGERVAIVGGGNTAMDAARTCVRLGAKEVHLLYRRTRDEMPAEKLEIDEAEEEGVLFTFLVAPESVLSQNGRAAGLSLSVMRLGEPDASGRRRPEATGETREMPFDTIIAAIGQQVRPEGIEALEKHRWQTIVIDPATYQTSVPGVFAGGDAVGDGPGIAITAIGHGKEAAQTIDSFLRGSLQPIEKPFYVSRAEVSAEDIPEPEASPRVPPNAAPPAVRVRSFDEYAKVLTGEEAVREAGRCLECGCCDVYGCRLLPLLQRYGAESEAIHGRTRKAQPDRSHPFIWRDENKCVLCGLCVRVCGELVGASALGFSGRGFDAAARPAFDWKLSDSDCVSCGHCVDVCPTGALQARLPYQLSPPLPLEGKPWTCDKCSRACDFTLLRHKGRVVQAVPLKRESCCSIGRYLPVIESARTEASTPAQREALDKALAGDLKAFVKDI